jgi:hypothetical protein
MRVILFDGERGIDRLDRIHKAMVKARKVNRHEFAHMLNMGKQNSRDYIYTLHEIMRTIHIVEWETQARGGHPVPVYTWGAGEDAPRPVALTRTEQYHKVFAENPAKLEEVRADARERQRKKRRAELKLAAPMRQRRQQLPRPWKATLNACARPRSARTVGRSRRCSGWRHEQDGR